MGGIRSITPASGVGCDPPLPRSSSRHTAQERGSYGTIPTKVCRFVKSQGLKNVPVPEFTAADLECLQVAAVVKEARCLDYLWLLGTIFRGHGAPGWSGNIKLCSQHLPFETSAVFPLPFINLDPNNPNALFTALDFAINEALQHGQKYCFVTFDQPLFWKAMDNFSVQA